MLKLYEYPEEIEKLVESAVDEETGEIKDELFLGMANDMAMERDKKLLGCAAYYKNLKAESEAIKKEADKLAKRARSVMNHADSLKSYMEMNMTAPADGVEGDKLKDAQSVLTWRKSSSVVVTVDAEKLPDEFKQTVVTVSAKKNDISKAIKEGADLDFAFVQVRQSLQIK